MYGIIGRKIGMTNFYDENGASLPCTLVEAGPCVVTQIKKLAKEKYIAVQLGYDNKKEKHTTKAMLGHFKRANTPPKRKLAEFRNISETELSKIQVGNIVTLEKLFKKGDFVDITGTSKGKGFQGVVKRHGFSGVGEKTHGQHNRERAPGSIGGCSDPSRVFKNIRMAGKMGNQRVKVMNLKVIEIIPEKNLMLVKGGVPGKKNNHLIIEK